MIILSKEQVEQMDTDACEQALVELDKKYRLDKLWHPKDWPFIDDITNTLLYLEDRIKSIKASETATEARYAVLARQKLEEE